MAKKDEQFFEERDSEGPVSNDRVTNDRVTNDRVTNDRVTIFDTTLRDGEQSPGASMNLTEKITIAKALKALGVDVIEAGFPIASPGDFEAVKAIAQQVQGPVIAALARCHEADIQSAHEALSAAAKSRIHVFLATSPIHRRYKLKMSREQVLEKTFQGITIARRYCDDVEFSAEDAARTEPEFLAEVVDTAIEAGAGTVNIPDTVGYAVPDQFGDFITYLRRNVPRIHQAVLSVHCHNDLGLAVANSLAAVDAGARQVECTINGIGERAGNCSLEEVVMALRTRGDVYQMQTGINTKHLYGTSQLVSRLTGLDVQRNKAIVGRNAFAHEAGIHQHGMLMHQETYEIMKPEDVGVNGNQLVLGKHSGRHAFQKWLQDQGYSLDERQFQKAFEALKRQADVKKELFDQDLHQLVETCLKPQNGPWFAEGAKSAPALQPAAPMEGS